MSTPTAPNWEHAPIDATHWAGKGPEDYLPAWYMENPNWNQSEADPKRTEQRWMCLRDHGEDRSDERINSEDSGYSSRPIEHMIGRPKSSENDIDSW